MPFFRPKKLEYHEMIPIIEKNFPRLSVEGTESLMLGASALLGAVKGGLVQHFLNVPDLPLGDSVRMEISVECAALVVNYVDHAVFQLHGAETRDSLIPEIEAWLLALLVDSHNSKRVPRSEESRDMPRKVLNTAVDHSARAQLEYGEFAEFGVERTESSRGITRR